MTRRAPQRDLCHFNHFRHTSLAGNVPTVLGLPVHPRPASPRRARGRALAAAAAVGVLAPAIALVPAAALAPASARAWPGHSDRALVRHVVTRGETATGLAVRFHAWTDELIRLNHLGPTGRLVRGRVVSIPVVLSAVHRAHPAPAPRHHVPHHVRHVQHHVRHVRHHHPHRPPLLLHSVTPRPRGWLHADMSRHQVRVLVSRVAQHYHVPRVMALAIAWQESGWQQRRVSTTGALGVMQVMPGTGRWMRWYAGRVLRLKDTHDNVQAGVLTLRVLRAWTRRDKYAIAAYYQGLGAVRAHGLYRDTRRYVGSVRAIERSLVRTGSPA